jgi:transcriptional regulator of heat shock response
MKDYSKGKIYTIRCLTDKTLIYVGSTIQSLAKRWWGHKCRSKLEKDKNAFIYRTINGDWDNWYIELNQLYPCSCLEELRMKEGEIQRLIGTLNVRIEKRTPKEYREDHKEEIKKYREDNKEGLTEYMETYNKVYYENNKDKIAVKNKTNYDEKYKQKITCECGKIINKHSLKLHTQSIFHTNFLNMRTIEVVVLDT